MGTWLPEAVYLEIGLRLVIRTTRADNARRLAETLSRLEPVTEFRLSPTRD